MNIAALLEDALEERGNALMVVADPSAGDDATILDANRPLARLLGQSPADLAGAPLRVLRAALATEADWLALVRALRSHSPLHLDLRLRPESQDRWLGVGLTFVTDASDGARYGILVGRDITETRRRGQQDSEMQRLLAAVFTRISAPVAIVRADGALLMSNPAFQSLLHYDAEAMAAMNIHDLTAPESRAAAQAIRARLITEDQPGELRICYMTRTGGRVPARVVSMPLRDWRGQALRVLTVLPEPGAVGSAPGAAAQPPAVISVGQVQAISLAAFKAAFGPVWERIAARALDLAEQILRRRLAPADVFTRSEDHGFIVWFDSGEPARNATLLAAAAREIRLRFLTEFGEAAADQVATVVVNGEARLDGAAPAASAALMERLRAARERGAQEARATLQAACDNPAADITPVIYREGRPRPIRVADFSPDLRQRLGAHALALVPVSERDTDIDLLRLRLAIEALERQPAGERLLVPIAWACVAGAQRRRGVEQMLGGVPPPSRARLLLAVSGAPPLPSGKRWSEVVAGLGGSGLGGERGEVGLMLTIAEGDNVGALEAIVAKWPFSLLVLDGTEQTSAGTEAYFGVIAAARRRDIDVLVRCAAAELHDWRELGATMFTLQEQG